MRKPNLVAVIMTIALVGCGSSRTATLTPVGSTAASSSSASSEGMGGTLSAVAACFSAAGAVVRGPHAAGPGLAVSATTPDGAKVGFVKAHDASTIKVIAKVFTHKGLHITMLKKDPTAFIFYGPRTSPTNVDSDLLRKCSARSSLGS